MKQYSLPRKERLRGSIKASSLFHDGNIINEFPLQCKYIITESDYDGYEVLFSVSKKRVKKAVLRNRLRRRIKEAWRLNVAPLRNKLLASSSKMQIGIYYQTDDILKYKEIELKINSIIQRLLQHYEKTYC